MEESRRTIKEQINHNLVLRRREKDGSDRFSLPFLLILILTIYLCLCMTYVRDEVRFSSSLLLSPILPNY